jgi:glycosyltransferase involved in cell wall biosynthesis
MEEWAKLFREVVIVAPEGGERGRGDLRAFQADHVRLEGLKAKGGRGLLAKLGVALAAPGWAAKMWRAMRAADVVHVRCPGNVGLVGAMLAPLAGRPMIAKYAGQWGSYPGEAWSYRLQRWLLKHWWSEGAVLFYGHEAEAPHLKPFFNSALTAEHLARAKAAATRERERGRLLFVGRLTQAKGVDVALQACAMLGKDGAAVRLDVAGEGPERERLEELAKRLGVAAKFHGGVPFEEVLGLYEAADILVLPSRTEGWPKVLVEAMAFGVPCVATGGGLNDWMVGDGRGVTAGFGDAAGVARAVAGLLAESIEERAERRRRCAEFGQRYSLEGVREGIRRVLGERWGLWL